MDKILEFPKQYDTPVEALEASKGWNFETVVIIGHTAEGGTKEGGIVISSNKASAKAQAKDLIFMSTLLHWMAVKQLGFYD